MKFKSYIKFLFIVIGYWFIGCTHEPIPSESSEGLVRFKVQCNSPSLKSVLGTDLNYKISDICLWAYDEFGRLETQRYFDENNSDDPELYLSQQFDHHIYALINMGELTAPHTQEEAEHFTCRYPSYKALSHKGIPMAGKLENLTANSTSGTIQVERLFAKISLTMTHGEIQPDEITQITIHNCNMKARPFSATGSRAETIQDITDNEEGEWNPCAGWENNQFTFYVPENVQGKLLPGNWNQNAKTPAALEANNYADRVPLCTYLEATVQLKDEKRHHGVTGTMKYRFYLGQDNSADFSILRNYDYLIDWSLTWNGQFYQNNWRVDNTGLNDQRKLELEGITGYTATSYGYEIQRGDHIIVSPGCTGGASVRYHIGGHPLDQEDSMHNSTYDSESNQFTLQHYDTQEGWRISPETQTLLQSYGISWKICQAVLNQDSPSSPFSHLDTGKHLSFITRSPLDQDSNLTGEQYRIYLLLSLPAGIAEGKKIPIVFQMKDGSASYQMNLCVGQQDLVNPDDFTYDLSVQKLLMGTCPTLTVRPKNSRISKIKLYVTSESSKLVELVPQGNNDYQLYLKNSGEATIHVQMEANGRLYNGNDLHLSIKEPVLKMKQDHFVLELDGEASPYEVQYFSDADSELPIEIAPSENDADGYSFSPRLYRQFLKPIAEILDGVTFEHQGKTIHCQQNHICLENQGEIGKIWLDQSYQPGATLSVLKISAPSKTIHPVYAPISTDNFLKEFDGSEKYGNYIFTFTPFPSAPSGTGIQMKSGARTLISNRKLIYNKKKYRIEIEENADQLEAYLDEQDHIGIRFIDYNKKLNEGKINLKANVYSLNKGELIMSRPLGYINSYIYTCMGPQIQKITNQLFEVSTTLLNTQSNEAFKNLYETLKTRTDLQQISFDNSKGWQQIGYENNCFSYPKVDNSGSMRIPNRGNDNYYLNIWKVLKRNGTIGDKMYQIVPGNGFKEDFKSWDNFTRSYSPELKINLNWISGLDSCPGSPRWYYYSSAQDKKRDENGKPFVLVYLFETEFLPYGKF